MSEYTPLVKHRSVRDSLQYVANHPQMKTDPIDTPMWELIARILFEIANSPDTRVRGSMGRATRAQRMISDRLVGLRRPGTHPARARKMQVAFVDLTTTEIGKAEDV